jgi:helicase required for RNAi-mediated heterochromatin assembly 1
MVALTPSRDNFRSKCIIATVAARPLDNVKATPCQIDIFFARSDEIEIDPQREFVMIEARSGYYEGSRHTLKALQKLHQERLVNIDFMEFIADLSSTDSL